MKTSKIKIFDSHQNSKKNFEILAIGDFHGKFPNGLPKNMDAILLIGDLGKSDIMRRQAFKKIDNPGYGPTLNAVKQGYMQAYNSTLKVLERLSKLAPVYFVYGNVESSDNETKKLSKEIGLRLPFLSKAIKKMDNVYHIGGKIRNLEGISIAGYDYFVEREWVKRFRGNDKKKLKKHSKEDKKARDFFRKLRKVDILLVHQPPYNVLDKVTAKYAPKIYQGKHAGSEIILSYIKRKHPDYVLCGHIHEASGEKLVGKTKIINLGERTFGVLEVH